MNAQRAALTCAQKSSGENPVALHIAGEEWLFSIASVKWIGRELFLQIALQGPALCSLTVHLRDRVVFGVTAPQDPERRVRLAAESRRGHARVRGPFRSVAAAGSPRCLPEAAPIRAS